MRDTTININGKAVKVVNSAGDHPSGKYLKWTSFSAKKENVGIFLTRRTLDMNSVETLPTFFETLSCLPESTSIIYITDEPTIVYTRKEEAPVINVVEKMLEYSGNYIIYDCAGDYEGILPAGCIENGNGMLAMWNMFCCAPKSFFDADKASDMLAVVKRKQEKRLLAYMADEFGWIDFDMISKQTSKSELAHMASHIRSWFSILLNDTRSFPMPDDDILDVLPMKLARREDQLMFVPTAFVTEEDLEYLNELVAAFNEVYFIVHAIERELPASGLPLKWSVKDVVSLSRDNGHKAVQINDTAMCALLDALGVYTYLDAYRAGVPIEDIFA